MSNLLAQVEHRLLMPAELTPRFHLQVLGQIVSARRSTLRTCIFSIRSVRVTWVLEDGIGQDGRLQCRSGRWVRGPVR